MGNNNAIYGSLMIPTNLQPNSSLSQNTQNLLNQNQNLNTSTTPLDEADKEKSVNGLAEAENIRTTALMRLGGGAFVGLAVMLGIVTGGALLPILIPLIMAGLLIGGSKTFGNLRAANVKANFLKNKLANNNQSQQQSQIISNNQGLSQTPSQSYILSNANNISKLEPKQKTSAQNLSQSQSNLPQQKEQGSKMTQSTTTSNEEKLKQDIKFKNREIKNLKSTISQNLTKDQQKYQDQTQPKGQQSFLISNKKLQNKIDDLKQKTISKYKPTVSSIFLS